jgi:hypothetical protein
MAAVEAGSGKTKVGSKAHKSTVKKPSKPEKR